MLHQIYQLTHVESISIIFIVLFDFLNAGGYNHHYRNNIASSEHLSILLILLSFLIQHLVF